MVEDGKSSWSGLLKKLMPGVIGTVATPAALANCAAAQPADIVEEMRRQLYEADALAVRIYATSELKGAQHEIEKIYRANPKAANADSADVIDSAAAATALEAAMYAANSDPLRPKVQWWNTREHTWPDGLHVPDSRFGLDNPDNFYTQFPVDGASSYCLVGQMPENPPVDITFSILTDFYHQSEKVRTVGFLKDDDMELEPDGRFVITIGPDGADGRPNHIQTTSEARVVQVRQTLGDWNTEIPFTYYVVRFGSEPNEPPASFEQRVSKAAELAPRSARIWAIDLPARVFDVVAPNSMSPLFSSSRHGGLASQMSSAGRFQLADDDALIIRTKIYGASYASLQLGDQWFVSANYVERTGNLNSEQVVASPDGSVTFVISPGDPGVYNWADPGPIRNGYISLRLQDVRDDAEDGEPLLETRLVKLSEVREALPSGTRFVNSQERKAQIAARVAGYECRIRAIMGEPRNSRP